MLKRALPLVLGATGIFVACGDETTIVEGGSIAMVADADALGDCDGDNEGELLWLKSEAQLRMCSGGEWLSMNGSVDTLYIADSKCSTEPLKDSSGVKIIYMQRRLGGRGAQRSRWRRWKKWQGWN